MKSKALVPLTLIAALIVGGCQTTAGDFCDVSSAFRPQASDDLTTPSKRWIVAHNEYGEERCGWEP